MVGVEDDGDEARERGESAYPRRAVTRKIG